MLLSKKKFSIVKFLKVLISFLLIFLTILTVILINADYFFPKDDFLIDDDISPNFCKLRNSSLYCYMNSLFQYLYHLEDFRNLVLESQAPISTFFGKLRQIFDIMLDSEYADLTNYYVDLIDMFVTKYNDTEAFVAGRMGCSFEALSFILSALVHEEQKVISSGFIMNYGDVRGTEVGKMFFLNSNAEFIFPYLVIDKTQDSNNLQRYMDRLTKVYPNNDPLPKYLSFYINIFDGRRLNNSAILLREITVKGVKYKFNGFLHLTSGGPHYTLYLYRNDKFYHLNDDKDPKAKAPLFDRTIKGVTGVFYSRV